VTALKETILSLVRDEGPITLADYMRLALGHPRLGYYATRDPLGRDFITAPEVSQMFGELIGLFLVQAWEDRGRPERFSLVELGPGRGTLMADILRAAKIRPAFAQAAHIVLVETSPALRAVQRETLRDVPVTWAAAFDAVPSGTPLFAVANEFFDALPIRQFQFSDGAWHERMVAADGDALCFKLAPAAVQRADLPVRAADGAVCEIGAEARTIAATIAERIARDGGVALVIDYGHTETGFGDTFQAVKAHRFADPFAEPGEADLTAHVDFARLATEARTNGAQVFGPVTQKHFLDALGIRERAEMLKRAAPNEAAAIDAAVTRLTGADQMGTLFKVMALARTGTNPLPGFPC
jgi:NADH dehydrogenase [ubiquinone] 1 alpha subcomplex assembly factor 7